MSFYEPSLKDISSQRRGGNLLGALGLSHFSVIYALCPPVQWKQGFNGCPPSSPSCLLLQPTFPTPITFPTFSQQQILRPVACSVSKYYVRDQKEGSSHQTTQTIPALTSGCSVSCVVCLSFTSFSSWSWQLERNSAKERLPNCLVLSPH